jgi:hypothetical protein
MTFGRLACNFLEGWNSSESLSSSYLPKYIKQKEEETLFPANLLSLQDHGASLARLPGSLLLGALCAYFQDEVSWGVSLAIFLPEDFSSRGSRIEKLRSLPGV